jgi:plasmid stabilization system protein ParE
MVRIIIWSKNALKDKVQILDYWHKRIGTKTYSKKLDKQLRHIVKGLKSFPEMGRQLENTDLGFVKK